LIIDYGYTENQIQNYPNGTLQAVKNHQYADVLKNAGSSDITALVDFFVLQKTALKNHLQTSLITQKEFLISLGIEARREKLLSEKNSAEQNQINSSINRLIDEQQMGELFKVLIIW
jgi:NADH dehydrogenase [ubiquinone] 1 alpha subcomplex assembly factor 7